MAHKKRFAFIFLSLLLISVNCLSQSPSYSINLKHGVFIDPNYYKIIIIRDSNCAIIKYKKTVKINYKNLEKDKNYVNLVDSIKQILPSKENSDPVVIKAFNRLENIYSKHILSKEDCISIKQEENQAYFNLIDSLYNSDTQYLLYEDRNRNRLVLDGTTTHITIFSNNIKMKDLYYDSPDYESHPIIARFINDTYKVYSQKKGINF